LAQNKRIFKRNISAYHIELPSELYTISIGMNGIIADLEELQDIASVLGEVYKAKEYRRVAGVLRQLPYAVTAENLTDVARRHKIGEAIMRKLREKLDSGHISELESLRSSARVASYRALGKIMGVGPNTIEKWLKIGVDSLPRLRHAIGAGRITLTNTQKYGLTYYADLNTRIPRAEIAILGRVVKDLLIEGDPGAIFELAGSYRREAATSGDVDILVSNRGHFDENLLRNMIAKLELDSRFIAPIVLGTERTTFIYMSPLSGLARQIDVLNIRYASFYAALLYFTGSWEFNESMRGYAKSKGYRLNQSGLYKITKNNLKPIPAASEADIFRTLELEYIPPAGRNGAMSAPQHRLSANHL
jgi:DNA polymerase/3'-5' exonuclease PolX